MRPKPTKPTCGVDGCNDRALPGPEMRICYYHYNQMLIGNLRKRSPVFTLQQQVILNNQVDAEIERMLDPSGLRSRRPA